MKVESEIYIYEVDGKACSMVGDTPKMQIKTSTLNKRTLVDIVVDGKRYTVAASEVREATINATNTGD